jgi:hypothetical protein
VLVGSRASSGAVWQCRTMVDSRVCLLHACTVLSHDWAAAVALPQRGVAVAAAVAEAIPEALNAV